MDLSSTTHQEQSSLWDWDSVLLLANPIPDSDGAASHQWQDQQHQEEEEEDHHPQQEQQQQQQQRRRRDPRLTCPNFLAGRVPCACSDVEDEEEDERLPKRSKVTPRCQVPKCQSDLVGLKGYHQRHRVCLTCANATSVFLRNQQQRYCQQCGKFHPLADFDSGKRSCRRKLEKHNNRRRRSLLREASTQSNTNNSDASDGAQRLPETPSAAAYDLEQRSRVEEQPRDDQSLLAALLLEEQQTDQTQQQDQHHTATHHEEQPSSEKRQWPTCASSDVRKHSTYTSPCPTRRISFKFYDWNPADFPRRLREQILEWLANMPVELEGYIRSGCTILTLYIAMPEESWSMLAQDWSGHLARLVRESETGFWDKGYVAAFLDDDYAAHIEHGLVSSRELCEANKRHPVIHSAFPLCLEAGKRSRVTVTGYNLLEFNSRLLVGSQGKYLPCYVSSGTCSLQVDLIAPQRLGVTFVEIAHDYGISNFVPLLVADNELQQELETLDCSDFSKRQDVFNLLTDLGWLIRCFQDTSKRTTSSQLTSSDTARLQRLLKFAVERGWRATVQRLLQVAQAQQAVEQVIIHKLMGLAPNPDVRNMLATVLAQAGYSSKVSGGANNSWYARSIYARQWKLVSSQMRYGIKYGGIVKAAMGLAVACVGVCIVLRQHPNQALELSTSLRRCLWYKQQS